MNDTKNPAIGSSWDEIRAELFTAEEIAESDLRIALVNKTIEDKHEKE